MTRCRNDIKLFNDHFMRGLPLWSGEGSGWEGQVEWCKAVEQYREVVLATGNNLGKSVFTSQVVIPWWAITRPGSLVVVTAASQNLIAQITWQGLKRAFEGFTTPEGVKHQPIIPIGAKISSGMASPATIDLPNGSRIIGLSTTTTERLSGLHNPNLLVVVEEASGVSDAIVEAIDGLGASKLVWVGNPLSQGTGFHTRYLQGLQDAACNIPPEQATKSIRVPSYASPHAHLAKSPWGIADKTWLDSMKRQHGEHSLWYTAHIDSRFPEQAAEVLIPQEHLSRATSDGIAASAAAWRRAGKGGRVRVACDVGEGVGAARTVIVVRDDVGFLELIADKHMDISSAAERIAQLKHKYRILEDHYISYDAGGSVGSRMKAALTAKRINAFEYYGGHPTTKFAPNYSNMRTAAACAFARRIDPEAILPGLEQGAPFHLACGAELGPVLEELEGLQGQLAEDKYRLQPKDDFAASLGRSPDFADAIGQSFWMEARSGKFS